MSSRIVCCVTAIAFCVVSASGCTHMQLQKNTNRQAKTVSAIYEEQVLDNLAMYVCNPYATPFFSVPGPGTNQVEDNGSVNASAGAFASRFWKFVSAGGSRRMNQSWSLAPVVDPNRIRLMQCAYQKAIGLSPDECNQCCDLEREWKGMKGTQRVKVVDPLTGNLIVDKTGNPILDKITGEQYVECPVCEIEKPPVSKNCREFAEDVECPIELEDTGTKGDAHQTNEESKKQKCKLSRNENTIYMPKVRTDPRTGKPYEYDPSTGEVTIPKQECQDPCGITYGWIRSSDCWGDVPKSCCERYGYHCGTYVWVDPCYQKEFSKLVMTIVDYASGTKASGGATKEVRFYLNSDGSPGRVEDHATAIVATVGSDKSLEEIEKSLNIRSATARQAARISEEVSTLEHKLKLIGEMPKLNDRVNEINSLMARSPSLAQNRNKALDGTSKEKITEEKQKEILAGEEEKINKYIKSQMKRRQALLESIDEVFDEPVQSSPPINFGPPTQFNSGFGGSLLPLQQQLNTVNPSRIEN